MTKEYIQAMLAELTDADLDLLTRMAMQEQERRLPNKALPPVLDEEYFLATTRKLDAIKKYKSRTGTSILEAKYVIDKCLKGEL